MQLPRRCGSILAALLAATSLTAGGQGLPSGTVADRVVIQKQAHTLTLYRGNRLLKTYNVALGPNVKGAK